MFLDTLEMYLSVILCIRQCFTMFTSIQFVVQTYHTFFPTTCFGLMGSSSGTLELTITHFSFCYPPYTSQCLHIGNALYVWSRHTNEWSTIWPPKPYIRHHLQTLHKTIRHKKSTPRQQTAAPYTLPCIKHSGQHKQHQSHAGPHTRTNTQNTR
jgi:hypothetical protein